MKHKTAELEGALLDAAVALAVGERYALARTLPDTPGPYRCVLLSTGEHFDPSSSWAHGGPLIEREKITVFRLDELGFCDDRSGPWAAGISGSMDTTWQSDSGYGGSPYLEFAHSGAGHTPLIAAMRAFVASKLGEEVELPG